MNLKHILLITLFALPNLMYSQENFCDGEWVEQITSYTCSSFNSSQSECISHAGCWFEANAYVGIYLWEDRCYGGTHTINNSYCDGEMVSSVWGCTDESDLRGVRRLARGVDAAREASLLRRACTFVRFSAKLACATRWVS